jgi:N-acetylmuramoyl-L-alanine amidase
MKEDFGDASGPAEVGRERLFLPWYLGYRKHRPASGAAANIFQDELKKGNPGWKVAVHTAPLAVLSSATMPSLLLEVGNLNNPMSVQTLMDNGFQSKLVSTIVDAVQRFSDAAQAPN